MVKEAICNQIGLKNVHNELTHHVMSQMASKSSDKVRNCVKEKILEKKNICVKKVPMIRDKNK